MAKTALIFVVITALFLSFASSQTADAPSAGDGSSGTPYQIATLNNLYWITQNNTEWGKYYIQTANIDASSTSGWDSGSGFSPIGNGTSSFTGSYDGGGYTISSLYISRSSTDYIGLFGFISDATVKNITLTSITISGASYVGGVVGFSTGSGSALIENCSSTGTVSGTTAHIGGLIGKTQAGTIVNNCFSTVAVSSTSGNNLGGFIGYHDQSSSINRCYSKGNATSPDGDHVGGFAGTMGNSATISNCYCTGNAYSYNRAGGFIGSKSSGTITNCYSIGSATLNGGSTAGGFIALNSGTVSNSFWDTDASGNGSSAAGTGKTTTQMKTQSTFTDAGWDFSTVWEMIGTNYPRLQSIPDGALPVELVSFTVSSIQTGAELKWNTATEVNDYGFEIERTVISHPSSVISWSKAGFVEGSGTINAPKEYSFTDKNLSAGEYSYRLKQIDRDGKFSYSQTVEVTVTSIPTEFTLAQNYPNPFNPSTIISYQLPVNSHVTLKVYDAIGREVATLVNEMKEAGSYSDQFDGIKLSSGMYFARLQSGEKVQLKKMILLK